MRTACFPFYKTFRKTGLFLYPKHRSVPKSGTPERRYMEKKGMAHARDSPGWKAMLQTQKDILKNI